MGKMARSKFRWARKPFTAYTPFITNQRTNLILSIAEMPSTALNKKYENTRTTPKILRLHHRPQTKELSSLPALPAPCDSIKNSGRQCAWDTFCRGQTDQWYSAHFDCLGKQGTHEKLHLQRRASEGDEGFSKNCHGKDFRF